MGDCECVSRCMLFEEKMSSMPATVEMFRNRYCRADFLTCARYSVYKALGMERVPADLFPNQEDRARKIVSGGE